MKVFITGGAGQVGSTVADRLLARGDTVLSIDNFATGRRDNLLDRPGLTQVEGSIADGALVEQLFADFKPDVVVHTAASYKDPEDWGTDALVNAVGTANIAKACKVHKVGRLVYFQTALCYGTKPVQQPIRLDHPINPVNSSYAISKTAGEHYVQFSGVEWVTFRLANVIGPRNVSGPLPIFYGRLAEESAASSLRRGAISATRTISPASSCRPPTARGRAPTTSPPARTWRSRSSTTRSCAP